MFPLTCQCDGAGGVAAVHRVVMDTLCVRLSLIHGLTLLSRHHSPSLSIVDEFKQESGLSVRAIACSTCYSQAYLMSPWCYRWTCLFLMQFTHKVSSLLPVWRSRVQVNQNLMTALGITAEITSFKPYIVFWAVIMFQVTCCLVLHTNSELVTFRGELYRQQAISPVTSRENRAYSVIGR